VLEVRAGAGGASWRCELEVRAATWRMLARAGAGDELVLELRAGATSWCHELVFWHGERELEPLAG